MYFGSGMTLTTLGIREDSKEEELEKEKVKVEKEKEDQAEDSSDLETNKTEEREKEREIQLLHRMPSVSLWHILLYVLDISQDDRKWGATEGAWLFRLCIPWTGARSC